MGRDAAVRLRYLSQTLRLLYPQTTMPRAYSLLPHAVLPRRLAPRAWWHGLLGQKIVLGVEGSIESRLSEVFGTRIRAAGPRSLFSCQRWKKGIK